MSTGPWRPSAARDQVDEPGTDTCCTLPSGLRQRVFLGAQFPSRL